MGLENLARLLDHDNLWPNALRMQVSAMFSCNYLTDREQGDELRSA